MRTKKLYKLLVFAKQEDKIDTINSLQHLGAMHVVKADVDQKQMQPDESLPNVDEISKMLLKLQYVAKETGVDNTFYLEGLPPAEKVLKQAKKFIDIHLEKVRGVVSRKKETSSKKARYGAQLRILSSLPFCVSHADIQNNNKLVLSSAKKIRKLGKLFIEKVIVKGENSKRYYYHVQIASKNLALALEVIKKSQIKIVDLKFLKGGSSQELIRFKDVTQKLTEELDEVDKRLFRIINGKQSKIKFLIASLLNYREQYNITRFFAKSKNFFAVSGYCEGKDVNRIKDSLPDTSIYVKVAKKGAPTKLENSSFSKNFELVTKMFGTPTYGMVDPTVLVTFFFPFFFGFMLSDIGYGLLLLLGVVGLYLHFGKTFKKGAVILGSSAISSIIFGALFGSFFGNLIHINPLFIDSFQGSFTILKIALVIGLIHINLGLVLNLYQLILQRRSAFVIFLKGAPYFLLQLSVILIIFKQYVLAIILGILLLAALIKDKGIFGIMDITGFFGVWFSYARLLALSLATAGVALAVNIVAEKALGFGWIGVA